MTRSYVRQVLTMSLLIGFFIFAILKIPNPAPKPTFACAINCMDGRAQDAVKNYVKQNYGVDFVDMVTEPGPNKILAENINAAIVENIKKRVEISVHHHGAKTIAIVGHFGCAGNPVSKEEQILHLQEAKKMVEGFEFDAQIILLWVDESWKANRIE